MRKYKRYTFVINFKYNVRLWCVSWTLGHNKMCLTGNFSNNFWEKTLDFSPNSFEYITYLCSCEQSRAIHTVRRIQNKHQCSRSRQLLHTKYRLHIIWPYFTLIWRVIRMIGRCQQQRKSKYCNSRIEI